MPTSDPAAWVPNPNYPADPRPFRPPPRPFDFTILHGRINAPTIFLVTCLELLTLFLATLPFRPPTLPHR